MAVLMNNVYGLASVVIGILLMLVFHIDHQPGRTDSRPEQTLANSKYVAACKILSYLLVIIGILDILGYL